MMALSACAQMVRRVAPRGAGWRRCHSPLGKVCAGRVGDPGCARHHRVLLNAAQCANHWEVFAALVDGPDDHRRRQQVCPASCYTSNSALGAQNRWG